MTASDDPDKLLINFFERPLNKRHFRDFFALCYKLTKGYLGYLRSKGYNLPTGTEAIDNELSDLSIDILGTFLRSEPGKPYAVIFDFLEKSGLTGFNRDDKNEVFNRFKSLLFRYIRQELSRIEEESDPQVANLKRRIKDIFKQSEYVTYNGNREYIEYISLAGTENGGREAFPPLAHDRLLLIVEKAYCVSKNRGEWCRNIFKALNALENVQNRLKKHELISAMINVNLKYVEVDDYRKLYNAPEATYRFYEREMEDTKRRSLSWLEANLLRKFVHKAEITDETAQRFLAAVDIYLTDLIYSPGVDLLPVYFREVMPEDEHSEYEKKYKYIFETIIRKTVEYFRKKIKISTKSSFSSYHKNNE